MEKRVVDAPFTGGQYHSCSCLKLLSEKCMCLTYAFTFSILHQKTLLPYLQEKFLPSLTHHFMQDNGPKHCSSTAQQFYSRVGINWWSTPAESPDANPIENLPL